MDRNRINNMPIGERDREDAGDVSQPSSYMQTLHTHEQWLHKTAARRNALRVEAERAFRAAHNRPMLRSERDLMLDAVNRKITSEYGSEPRVRM